MRMKNSQLVAKLSIVAALLVMLILAYSLKPKTPSPVPVMVPDFSAYPAGTVRKKVFFDFILPMVRAANDEIRKDRCYIETARNRRAELSVKERRRLQRLAEKYELTNFDDANDADWQTLLRRADIVPASLALAQAANESAWGTSRFASVGNNYFGQWCFEKGCGLVPKRRDHKKTHEVKRFDSPQASVQSYIRNINTHRAYRELRNQRQAMRANNKTISGIGLAEGLRRYSERGEHYIDELQAMIRFNKLSQFDRPPSQAEVAQK